MFLQIKKFLLNIKCLSCKSTKTESYFHICPKCINKLSLVKQRNNLCPLCHDHVIIDDVCQNCHNEPPLWSKLHTIFMYEGILKNIFQQYKFKDSCLAEKDLVNIIKPYFDEFSHYHIIVTPCSKTTYHRLGFNPVTQLFKHWTTNYSEPFLNLDKVTFKHLNRSERQTKNRKLLLKKEYIKKLQQESSLLLVDDVFTTGSTVKQLLSILNENSISNVEVLCLFRS